MVDSVNIRQESPVHTPQQHASGEASVVQANSKPGAGFPVDNSFSTLNAPAADQPVSVDISPDEPRPAQAAPQLSDELLTKSFEARLDGVRATVHDFNRKFNAQGMDISDGRTLMLMFRGVMADIQARIGLEYIGDAYTSRSLDQRKRSDIADRGLGVRDNLNQREIEVDSKTELLHEKNQEFRQYFDERMALVVEKAKLMKEQESTGVDHSEKIAQLDEKAVQSNERIKEKAGEIKTLAGEIKAKGELNKVDRAVLAEAEALLSIVPTIMVNMDKLLERVVQDFSSGSLETGEDRIEELKEAELQARLAFIRDDERLHNRKDVQVDAIQKHTREGVSSHNQSISVGSQTSVTVSESFLHESDFEAIGEIFFPDSQLALEELLAELEKALDKSEERRADERALIEEGLSVIL